MLITRIGLSVGLVLAFAGSFSAQEQSYEGQPSALALAQGPGNPNANVNSTEVLPDHRVVFRIYAPNAKEDTVVGNSPRLLDETLTTHKIRHEYHETEGGHSYANWRPYLRDFAQLLFR
jgi:enterochelin esterase-like enzyme